MYHKIIGGKKKKKQKNILKSVEYLLREKNIEEQKYIKILSGSKSDIINFNNYSINKEKENPYVCGVLSFEEEEINQDLKIKIISDFEELLFAGIEQENRPPILWVEHNDKNRVELNYLTFNQLQDKRAYTVYYDKSDRGLVNSYSEIINYENNLSSPFEEKPPEIGFNSLIRKPKTDTPQEKKDFIENINAHILAKIINQELENRNDVIEYIKSIENVKINRIRKNQISIKSDYFKDNIPMVLKGDIYEENRNYIDYTREYTATITRDPELVKSKLKDLTNEYTRGLEKRTRRNKERYKKPQSKNIQKNRKNIKRENRDIEHLNTSSFNSNIGLELPDFNNNFFMDHNKEITHDNRENKPKDTTEERRESERTREIEEIFNQQQRIDQITEAVLSQQHRIRESIKTTEFRFEFTRKHLTGFIQFFQKIIRPIHVFTRKNETQKRREEKRLKEKKNIKTQEVKRIKFKWWYKEY